jgi:hypothetical protein
MQIYLAQNEVPQPYTEASLNSWWSYPCYRNYLSLQSHQKRHTDPATRSSPEIIHRPFHSKTSTIYVNRRFGATYQVSSFHAGFLLGLFLTLKMEVIYASETSIDFQLTTRPYIPEDRTLHNHRCENLNSYNQITLRKYSFATGQDLET